MLSSWSEPSLGAVTVSILETYVLYVRLSGSLQDNILELCINTVGLSFLIYRNQLFFIFCATRITVHKPQCCVRVMFSENRTGKFARLAAQRLSYVDDWRRNEVT